MDEQDAGTVEPAAGPGADVAARVADSLAIDPDDLEAMGDEIARLSVHLQAATRRYRELVAELDRRRRTGDSEGSGRRFT